MPLDHLRDIDQILHHRLDKGGLRHRDAPVGHNGGGLGMLLQPAAHSIAHLLIGGLPDAKLGGSPVTDQRYSVDARFVFQYRIVIILAGTSCSFRSDRSIHRCLLEPKGIIGHIRSAGGTGSGTFHIDLRRMGNRSGLIRIFCSTLRCGQCIFLRLGCRPGTGPDRLQLFLGKGAAFELLELHLQLIPNRKCGIRREILPGVCPLPNNAAHGPGGGDHQLPVRTEAFQAQVKVRTGLHDLVGNNSSVSHIQNSPLLYAVRVLTAASAYQIFGQSFPGIVIFNCNRDSHHPGRQGSGHRSLCLCSCNL